MDSIVKLQEICYMLSPSNDISNLLPCYLVRLSQSHLHHIHNNLKCYPIKPCHIHFSDSEIDLLSPQNFKPFCSISRCACVIRFIGQKSYKG